jgi:hypothetical protein
MANALGVKCAVEVECKIGEKICPYPVSVRITGESDGQSADELNAESKPILPSLPICSFTTAVTWNEIRNHAGPTWKKNILRSGKVQYVLLVILGGRCF